MTDIDIEMEAFEVQTGSRRALRRAVSLDCGIISRHWDGPVVHKACDLSPYGLWVDALFPLELGERVALAFTPPRWRLSHEIVVFGEVRRSILGRRRGEDGAAGMGVEFLDVSRAERAALAAILAGTPPPLPRGPVATPDPWLDVTSLLDDEETSDRVNRITLHAPIAPRVQDDELEIVALGDLLCSHRRAA